MKKQLHSFTFSIITIAICTIGLGLNAQTIRRVNNTAGLNDPNVYSTIQAAHNAAVAGDIISLEPSENPTYGNLVCSKTLKIVGPGYFLDKNPNTFFDKRLPAVGHIQFINGSQNSSIEGVAVIAGSAHGTVQIGVPGVAISRCKIGTIQFNYGGFLAGYESYGNQCTIKSSIIGFVGGESNNPQLANQISISNCILMTGVQNLRNSTISYNTFNVDGNSRFYSVINCTITNNIFDTRGQGSTFSIIDYPDSFNSGNSVSNNLCIDAPNGLPEGSGNVRGAVASSIFINSGDPFGTYGGRANINYLPEDKIFQLSQNSPAKTAAAGGGEAGAFGNGVNAYKLSGLPASPIITNFTNTGSGTNTTPLTITISVRSNN